jgi:hypothetical protein
MEHHLFKLKRELPTIFFILAGTIMSLVILVERDRKLDPYLLRAAPILYSTPIPIPTVASVLNESTTVYSPDGTSKLVMKKQISDSLVDYSFFTSQLIFQKTESRSQSLSIPYNTWSPDNKYVFLKEATLSFSNYFVFSADGSSQSVDVKSLFNQKVPDYVMTEVTGWAAPYLLIVNTKTKQGEQGPSFWLDISTQSFIQLSTHFG